jgi:hypothetical protein
MFATEIKDNGGPNEEWKNMVDNSPNGYHVADAWKALYAQCARKLRRRALTEEDPVSISTAHLHS